MIKRDWLSQPGSKFKTNKSNLQYPDGLMNITHHWQQVAVEH